MAIQWNAACSAGRTIAARRVASRLAWPCCIGLVALLATSVAMSMSWQRLPAPSLHDEFSNLLLADTLLHGRLANPAPQIWQPFQTFHVLVNPSYASKYPLGSGTLLALGWYLWGVPIAGVWLSVGLAAAAITWAAAGCMPKRWALLSGLLLALSPSVHHHWSLCYMNGWLTAACGGLVAGAALRLRKRVEPTHAILLGCGIAGLALTRPFEGFVATLCTASLILYWWRAEAWSQLLPNIARAAAWSAPPVLLAMLIIATHNVATTGRLTVMPYQMHEVQYGVAPLNVFQQPKEPQMTQWSADVPPTVRAFHYGWSLESYQKRNSLAGWCGAVAERFHVVTKLWGIVFCMPVAVLIVVRRTPLRALAAALGAGLFVSSFIPWYYSHYFAPSLVWLVILSTLSCLWLAKRLLPDRRLTAAAIAGLLVYQAVFMFCEIVAANRREPTWADDRQQLNEGLGSQGYHLVLVRYHANHNVHDEWVYNGADLEMAPVIWARSWRPDLDQQLIEHYRDRQIWILQLDEHDRPQLTPLLALSRP